MRRIKFIMAIGVTASLVIVALIGWLIIANRQSQPHLVPATNVQNAVRGIAPSDIAVIHIDAGPHAEGVYVRDPKVIALLLKGLQEAEVPEWVYWNRTDYITLKLKNGKAVGGSEFNFNAQSRVSAFSPEFIKGLKAAGLRAGTQP